MITLYLDTASTTGAWLWGHPETSSRQPHLIRLAYLLWNSEMDHPIDAVCVLVKPQPGWPSVDPKDADRHGVYDDDLHKMGTNLGAVTARLSTAWGAAQQVVGHNVGFHTLMVRRAFRDSGLPEPAMRPTVCTMRGTVDLVRSSPMMLGKWKFPRLAESYAWAEGHGLSLPADPIERGLRMVEAVRRIHVAMDHQPPPMGNAA